MKLRDVCFLLTLVFILVSCPTDEASNPGGQTPQAVTTPSATPAGGDYTTAQTVTLATATADADIHYTLDGTNPTAGSAKYSSTITISETKTLKAVAVKTGMTDSTVLTETYTITPPGQVIQPTATPPGGNYPTVQTVTLATSTPEAGIHYTLDGTTPTTASATYTNPITISATATLKAIAVKADMVDSAILTATYTIGYTVTFDADGGSPAPTSPIIKNQGDTVTQPSAMTKAWHAFGGWYTDSARTVPALFPITVNGNVNLYARWIINTLTSVADVSNYLASLPVNTVNNPASLPLNFDLGTMTAAGSGWRQLLDAVSTANRYVALNLSICTMSGTAFNPDASVATGKDRIVSIILPTVAESIAPGSYSDVTFKNFSSLKSISGTYITTIGNYSLRGDAGNNTTLQSVDFPRATNIGNHAFRYSSLQSVSFPLVVEIGISAFSDCTALQSVSFPLVKVIGNSAFEYCSSLTGASFPQATNINDSAFSYCTSLQSISFPASAAIIIDSPAIDTYTYPFSGCTSLTSFTLTGMSSNISVIENGKALVRNSTELVAYPSASGTIAMNTITSIRSKAFNGCNGLQSASFPQAVSIGISAFSFCSALQSLSIPKVTAFGNQVFSSTGNATLSITMGAAAPALGSNMFSIIFNSKTVIIKIPSGATGYSPAPSPFTGSAVTVSGTNDTVNWGNGFRGGGWTGTTWATGGGTSRISQYITVIIEQQ